MTFYNRSRNGTLGILTSDIPKHACSPHDSYPLFAQLGTSLGLTVYRFTCGSVNQSNDTVEGYVYNVVTHHWENRSLPLPNLIFDRRLCSASITDRRTFRYLRDRKQIPLLGHPLPGKWNVYRALITSPECRPFLPQTERFRHLKQLERMLSVCSSAFLKPIYGMQGRGVMAISERKDQTVTVQGRDRQNTLIYQQYPDRLSCFLGLQPYFQGTPYLLQPYLSLQTDEGKAFDIRILVQKNEIGRWTTTGMVSRCGKEGSVTSNLHGGGEAVEAFPHLSRTFGLRYATRLMEQLNTLVSVIPMLLEKKFGRLVELGIDLGVDQNGHIWIIEVNSKPGRSAFRALSDSSLYISSHLLPLRYAYYVLNRPSVYHTVPSVANA